MTAPPTARDDAGVVRVLFVCLGNICRSPTAEAVMRHLVDEAELADRIEIDSAGTGDWHLGEPPDQRSQEVGRRRGMPLGGHARQVDRADFEGFDYLVAMDAANRDSLLRLAPDDAGRSRVHLLRDFDPASPPGSDVPDPYYGGPQGFDQVFDICVAGCGGLLDRLRTPQVR